MNSLLVIFVLVTFSGIWLFGIVMLQHENDLLVESNKFGNNLAYGHFFGDNKTIDGFRVVFLPFPPGPTAGENATLNFSVLDEENSNINNIFSALIIKEKESNRVVEQIPYKRYEFSDFSIPYKFGNNTNYVVTLETRVMGDPKYQAKPIVASFDLSVGDLTSIIYRNLMIYFVTPASLLVAVCCVVVLYRRKRQGR
ncbi:MAG: hypothetical protein ACRD5J_09585 [Nitrososphaeraceae archaeon]